MKNIFYIFIFLTLLVNPAQSSEQALIPAGEFVMGTDQGTPAEQPVHKIYLDDFYLDRFEVSNKNYEMLDPNFIRSSTSSCDDCPATRVNWHEAQAYCQNKNQRLPTEAEWEKARRGPTNNRETNRSIMSTARHGLPMKAGATTVNSPSENGYGIHHLAGNVWEWVSDWHGNSYYQDSSGRNPNGPEKGIRKSVRGGSWYNAAWYLQPGMRFQLAPHVKLSSLGFRCSRPARTLKK